MVSSWLQNELVRTPAPRGGKGHEDVHKEAPRCILCVEYIGAVRARERDLCLCAPTAHDDREHQGQDQLGGMVRAAADTGLEVSLDQAPDLELVAKTLDQPHAAEVCGMGFLE